MTTMKQRQEARTKYLRDLSLVLAGNPVAVGAVALWGTVIVGTSIWEVAGIPSVGETAAKARQSAQAALKGPLGVVALGPLGFLISRRLRK